ncbi:MAG: hypothetical protein EOP86_27405, partial [Verrucomicrobiaceae bacterium]
MPCLLPTLPLHFLILLLLPPAVSASLYQPLTAFEAGVKSPDRARLTPHPDAGFYGTLNDGGESRPGLIYRIPPFGGIEIRGRLLQGTGQPARLSGSLTVDAG